MEWRYIWVSGFLDLAPKLKVLPVKPLRPARPALRSPLSLWVLLCGIFLIHAFPCGGVNKDLAWPSNTLASLLLTFLQPSLASSFRKEILKVSEEYELLQHIFWMVSTLPRAMGHLVQPQHNDFMSLVFFCAHRVPWGHSPDSDGVSGVVQGWERICNECPISEQDRHEDIGLRESSMVKQCCLHSVDNHRRRAPSLKCL